MDIYEKLKKDQIEEFTADVIIWKEKVKFSLISACFFALCTAMIFFSPVLPNYIELSFSSATISVIFFISTYRRNEYLKMYKNNVRMIHSIHRQIDEAVEEFDKNFDAGKFDGKI